jgi:hypothetical protein
MHRTLTVSNPPKHRSLILEYQFETDDITFVCLYSKRFQKKQTVHDYYVPTQYNEYLNKEFGSSYVEPFAKLDEDDGPPGWMITGWEDGDDIHSIRYVFKKKILKDWQYTQTRTIDNGGGEFTRVYFQHKLDKSGARVLF